MELIFIPLPALGHLIPMVEFANLLTNKEETISISILLMKLPFDPNLESYIQSLFTIANPRLRFVELPHDESILEMINSFKNFTTLFIEEHAPHVRRVVNEILHQDAFGVKRIDGFVVDMFVTSMMDLATEFGAPAYVFYPTGAAMLGLQFHFQTLRDYAGEDVAVYKGSDSKLSIPTYAKPFPAKLLPSILFDKDDCSVFLAHARRFRDARGIIVNTFPGFEPHALEVLSRSRDGDGTIPPVYPLGPIIQKSDDSTASEILKWLDDQPENSVVFLCFGTAGCFNEEQAKEVACALERSRHRFVWSLRQPSPKESPGEFYPSEFQNREQGLPEGFMERMASRGKVIGFAPQVEILSHPAVGGFISHCGWNSILQSLSCGVPIAAWPMYGEQQANAFILVKCLGLGVEINMEYNKDFKGIGIPNMVVSAEKIENAIKCLMDPNNEVRKRAKEMKEKSRKAKMEGGTSYDFLGRFLENVGNKI